MGSKARGTQRIWCTVKAACEAQLRLCRADNAGLWSRRPRVRVPSLTLKEPLLTRGFRRFGLLASDVPGVQSGSNMPLARARCNGAGFGVHL